MATTTRNKVEQEFPLDEGYVTKILFDVVDNYLHFLCVISSKYLVDLNNKDINKRKFEEVRQELYEFVKKHRVYILFSWYAVFIPDQNEFTSKFDLQNLDTAETFIGFEKFVEFFQQGILVYRDATVEYKKTIVTKTIDINDLLERVFEQPIAEIKIEDVMNLAIMTFLDDQKWKGSKTSYRLLSRKLERRTIDFRNDRISTERMEELSFTLDDATRRILVDNAQCSVCLGDYENGQIVCRTPCRHFFHRRCLDDWFKPEKCWADSDSEDEDHAGEGAEENGRQRKKFQCPICRHNCC